MTLATQLKDDLSFLQGIIITDLILTGEFVIVPKFGGHVLHDLASKLANVIR